MGPASRKWIWVVYSYVWLEDEEQQTLKQERFKMNVRGNIFPMPVQQWNKLHAEIAQSPFLEVFKTHLI